MKRVRSLLFKLTIIIVSFGFVSVLNSDSSNNLTYAFSADCNELACSYTTICWGPWYSPSCYYYCVPSGSRNTNCINVGSHTPTGCDATATCGVHQL